MPIHPKNKHLYPPKLWKQLRRELLERAGNRCEGSPQYPECRAENYRPHPITGSKVILTMAHLDYFHGLDRNYLRIWCQRCHNRYDMPMRVVNAKRTRESKNCLASGKLA